VSEEWQNLKYT